MRLGDARLGQEARVRREWNRGVLSQDSDSYGGGDAPDATADAGAAALHGGGLACVLPVWRAVRELAPGRNGQGCSGKASRVQSPYLIEQIYTQYLVI